VTLQETADRINALFHTFGLDHDVVEVQALTTLGGIRLDERENEPDPNKWRAVARITPPMQSIVLINASDESSMDLLFQTLSYVFDTYFERYPPTDQLRLF
jgi:hypothetical protein